MGWYTTLRDLTSRMLHVESGVELNMYQAKSYPALSLLTAFLMAAGMLSSAMLPVLCLHS